MLTGGGCDGWSSCNHFRSEGLEKQPRDDGAVSQKETGFLKEFGELLYQCWTADI